MAAMHITIHANFLPHDYPYASSGWMRPAMVS